MHRFSHNEFVICKLEFLFTKMHERERERESERGGGEREREVVTIKLSKIFRKKLGKEGITTPSAWVGVKHNNKQSITYVKFKVLANSSSKSIQKP